MRAVVASWFVLFSCGCVAPEPERGEAGDGESFATEECGGFDLDDPDFECPEGCFREVPRVYDPMEGCTRRVLGAFCLSEIANNGQLCGTESDDGPFYEFSMYSLPDGASWRVCEEKDYTALRDAPPCDAGE